MRGWIDERCEGLAERQTQERQTQGKRHKKRKHAINQILAAGVGRWGLSSHAITRLGRPAKRTFVRTSLPVFAVLRREDVGRARHQFVHQLERIRAVEDGVSGIDLDKLLHEEPVLLRIAPSHGCVAATRTRRTVFKSKVEQSKHPAGRAGKGCPW